MGLNTLFITVKLINLIFISTKILFVFVSKSIQSDCFKFRKLYKNYKYRRLYV